MQGFQTKYSLDTCTIIYPHQRNHHTTASIPTQSRGNPVPYMLCPQYAVALPPLAKIRFPLTSVCPSFCRWMRSTIVVRSLARIRLIAQARGAHALQLATLCVEFRFRQMCKFSVSMSVYSRAYRAAAALVLRRWTKVVKNASLAARCHVFREAELVLRSLIRRRSQQIERGGMVRSSNADRCPSVPEIANTEPTSTKMKCLEAQDESWLVAAEEVSKAERLRTWGKRGGDDSKDSSFITSTNGAARQR